MTETRYTKDHEWVRLEGDVATVGITHHAQEALGDLVFVDLPEPGQDVAAEETCAVVESVKAASDVFAPISGEVTAANGDLGGTPETVNEAPEGAGWFVKVKVADPDEIDGLMDRSAYEAFLATL